ncbi:DoxX family protein [Mycolicibacterium wolinskyi]|uniref:DoxX family protein n=1 Tax=Mycolicibacterium wolinskyi TaxID=59750 RepID=A0A1X2F5N5_9MYCO|nr:MULTISPECIES: DoxX family protein [Mycolicibacterium]MCV7289069.1 DoxX family protein [Mycolicibacterium wolinskyi]MCV7296496.1 DoxX family protein [Mycolicibacterium goodii]ORX13299.1 hypothetical protein AWC31_01865 [Mycolicibacterium wolinskyi]
MPALSVPQIEQRLRSQSQVGIGVFRIVIGLSFGMHGTMKLFGWPDGTAAALGAWPMWWAGVLEVVLGSLVTLGLGTRVAAFIASGIMAVAYFWVHFPDGFWPSVNGGESAVLYCFAFLLLVFTGPGVPAVTGIPQSRR